MPPKTLPLWREVLNQLTPAHADVLVPVSPEIDILVARPDPRIAKRAHLCLAFFYAPLCLLFFAFVMYGFVTRRSSSALTIDRATKLSSVGVVISTACTNAPWCGTVTLSQNYSSSSNCGVLPVVVTSSPTPVVANVSLCLPLGTPNVLPSLFTSKPLLPIPAVLVEFSAINPGMNSSKPPSIAMPERAAAGVVNISDTDGRLLRTVTLNTWEVKTALFHASAVVDQTQSPATTTVSVVPRGIQYDGRRSSWRATLIIALQPDMDVTTVSKPPPWTVLQALGTAFYGTTIVLLAFVWLIPVVRGCCSGSSTDVYLSDQLERSGEKLLDDPAPL